MRAHTSSIKKRIQTKSIFANTGQATGAQIIRPGHKAVSLQAGSSQVAGEDLTKQMRQIIQLANEINI